MPKPPPPNIADLFDIPSRFMRSVQLERDYDDPQALENYIVTPAMAAAFQRVAKGVAPGSRQRAWRITGDYGVGKSSFAVVLAHLLSGAPSERAEVMAERMGWAADAERPALWPLLVTGARESMAVALARGIGEGLERRRPRRAAGKWTTLAAQARTVQLHPDADAVVELLDGVRALAAEDGAGVLLVIDELGKLLEYAAGEPDREDVYLLQRLAQTATRSGETPFFLVGLLHQGFQAYAERLPTVARHEWDKVAGRFEEIVLDQPMAHTAALVSGALGVRTDALDKEVQEAARETAAATATMGWMSGATSAALNLETAQLYPLHPTLLPPLVRFFSRFGQHERSLFGFLLSSEPFGLQTFAERPAGRTVWYGLPEFYDYVRAVFGHRLEGNSYQSNWLRIAATVDTAHDLDDLEVRALKVTALLSLLDFPELLATDTALRACLTPATTRDVNAAIATLLDRGLLFKRGKVGGYRLWPNTSVNLHAALEDAARAVGDLEAVSENLIGFLEHEPLLARRHYIDRGTMRFFEVRYAPVDRLVQVVTKPTLADGLVVVALADTPADQARALQLAESADLATRQDVVIGVTRPLAALLGDVKDLMSWRWVADHTPELVNDAYAAAEVSRELAAGRRALDLALGITAALRDRGSTPLQWRWKGEDLSTDRGLSFQLSTICDALYEDAPRISNELLNRKMLSSPAAAARMRLIEGLFDASDQPCFGIDADKAPPEKSMFLSVVQAGGLQQSTLAGLALTLPPAEDPLRLRPALVEIERILDASDGAKVNVQHIFDALAKRPFGVRAGVAPLLLAVIMKLRLHELAVYENGTFRSSFGGADFVRLIKGAETFDLQQCRVEGVRAEVFARLASAFADPQSARDPQILDVVQPLARFAAKLQEYTRKAGNLQPRSVRVRDVLLSATEPATMLFRDLPIACEVEPFATDGSGNADQAKVFVSRLEAAIEDMRTDYPKLLTRIIETTSAAIGQDDAVFDRLALAQRASRVAATASLPKLRTFALRLRDANTSDEAWAEALASFLIAKPPARWNAADEQRCLEELAGVSQLFHRVETAAFENGALKGDKDAVLVKLTQASGDDRGLVVQSAKLSQASERLVEEIGQQLNKKSKAERLQILARLLWEDLPAASDQTTDEKTEARRA